jgi:hypothetical protein
MYYDKYLKYKKKYLQLKNQLGGVLPCKEGYRNLFDTCWMVSIQTIFSLGQASGNDLFQIMSKLNLNRSEFVTFIDSRITDVSRNHQLNDIFPPDIFVSPKKDYLKILLLSFINRYFNKILKVKLSKREEDVDEDIKPAPRWARREHRKNLDKTNSLRCELVIAQNFKKIFPFLFKYESKYNGDTFASYLFANLLSIFILGYKLSFTRYYNKFNLINFKDDSDIGILVNIESHVCCLYKCNGEERYYNDNNDRVYNSKWKNLLKRTNELFIVYGLPLTYINYKTYANKEDLEKVEFLDVVSKHSVDSSFDIEIKKMINIKFIQGIKKYNVSEFNEFEFKFLIAEYLMYGEEVQEDIVEAKRILSSLADEEYYPAQIKLSKWYKSEGDLDESFRLLRLAANQRYKTPIIKLGEFLESQKYYQEAKSLYEEVGAYYNLGQLYEYGRGVSKDIKKAIKFYEFAIEKMGTPDSIEALYRLGWIYDYNILGYRDKEKARNYYLKAAEFNHEGAKRELSDIDEDYSWSNSESDSDDL